MNPIFNPPATFPFCPEQTDFLTFRTPTGFAGVDLNLVESVQAGEDNLTAIHLTNNNWYESTESVPELISRYSAIKKLRYAKVRAETELMQPNPLITGQIKDAVPEAKQTGIKWSTKPPG